MRYWVRLSGCIVLVRTGETWTFWKVRETQVPAPNSMINSTSAKGSGKSDSYQLFVGKWMAFPAFQFSPCEPGCPCEKAGAAAWSPAAGRWPPALTQLCAPFPQAGLRVTVILSRWNILISELPARPLVNTRSIFSFCISFYNLDISTSRLTPPRQQQCRIFL